MTDPRTCDWCGDPLPVTHRADARFCNELHRALWHNEQRRETGASDIRIDAASGHESGPSDRERVRWEAAIDQAIRRKLIETGEVHANDVDGLPVPHQLRNLIGNRFRVFTSRRLMAKTGDYRPVTHPAAHGRSAPVYRITQKGRAELVGPSAGGGGDLRKERLLETPRVEASAGPGGLPAARVEVSPAPPESSPRGSGGRDEAGQLFELPRPGNAHTDPRAA